ncbi:MAG: hypothetical protein ACREVX_14625 [Clostridium sp.]|uniref:hypothetical protein n=1 Tax=Clostridium sp. TaxID=1506 RepID=UPI003D6C86BB
MVILKTVEILTIAGGTKWKLETVVGDQKDAKISILFYPLFTLGFYLIILILHG